MKLFPQAGENDAADRLNGLPSARPAATPVAKIVAYSAPTTPRRPGALKGEIQVADDFDETPADFAAHS